MRTLGRLFIGLIVLGLMLGFVVRGRWPRRHLRWLVAVCFAPALLHAVYTGMHAAGEGVELAWVGVFVGVALTSALAGWWYAVRIAPARPVGAALVVPAQALFQGLASGALERAVIAMGASVDPVATAALGGVAIMLAAALLVVLPTREHFRWLPRAPAWWVALLRALGKR